MQQSSQKELIKKMNARTQKWRAMLSDGLFKNQVLLRSRTRKGIPPGIRILAWPELLKLPKIIESSPYNYQKLTHSLSNNIYEITLDIPRTFPEEEDSKYLRKSLNNVLKAISIAHPKVGYCQGMNFLAVRLLQILNDQNTFWMLHSLFVNDPYLQSHFVDPRNIEKQNFIFIQLVKEKMPAMYSHFQQIKIMTQTYTIKWFMTLFSSTMKQELFNRIFEVYLLEGWPIIHSVGLALLKNNQKNILKNSMEDNHVLLGSGSSQISDNNVFMESVYAMGITHTQILALDKKYRQQPGNSVTLSSQNRRKENLQVRQSDNKTYKFQIPQDQNIEMLQFQNQSVQINFEQLSWLKPDRNPTKQSTK